MDDDHDVVNYQLRFKRLLEQYSAKFCDCTFVMVDLAVDRLLRSYYLAAGECIDLILAYRADVSATLQRRRFEYSCIRKLPQLPAEIQRIIFQFCDLPELMSLAQAEPKFESVVAAVRKRAFTITPEIFCVRQGAFIEQHMITTLGEPRQTLHDVLTSKVSLHFLKLLPWMKIGPNLRVECVQLSLSYYNLDEICQIIDILHVKKLILRRNAKNLHFSYSIICHPKIMSLQGLFADIGPKHFSAFACVKIKHMVLRTTFAPYAELLSAFTTALTLVQAWYDGHREIDLIAFHIMNINERYHNFFELFRVFKRKLPFMCTKHRRCFHEQDHKDALLIHRTDGAGLLIKCTQNSVLLCGCDYNIRESRHQQLPDAVFTLLKRISQFVCFLLQRFAAKLKILFDLPTTCEQAFERLIPMLLDNERFLDFPEVKHFISMVTRFHEQWKTIPFRERAIDCLLHDFDDDEFDSLWYRDFFFLTLETTVWTKYPYLQMILDFVESSRFPTHDLSRAFEWTFH